MAWVGENVDEVVDGMALRSLARTSSMSILMPVFFLETNKDGKGKE